MRTFLLERVTLPASSPVRSPVSQLSHAAAVAYGEELLREMHGSSVRVGPWTRGCRKIQVDMAADVVPLPKEIKRFVCGSDKIRSTVDQQILRDSAESHLVRSTVKPHVVGAELFQIRSVFELQQSKPEEPVTFAASVEAHAILPPPLNGIVEAFMIEHARYDLESFASRLSERLGSPSRPPVDTRPDIWTRVHPLDSGPDSSPDF
jgi:hypothetical protein